MTNSRPAPLAVECLEDRETPAVLGVNVAVGNVIEQPDDPGSKEVIIGAGPGGGPVVQVYDTSGNFISAFLAFGEGFRGGVKVAVGDIDNNGVDEIVCTPGVSGGPAVVVFDGTGQFLNGFLVYDENFRGGVDVAVGNVTGDDADEIVTAVGPGGGPIVSVLNQSGKFLNNFFSFDPNYRGGLRVAVGDVVQGGYEEIVTGLREGIAPIVTVQTNTGAQLGQFLAYDSGFTNGVWVAVGDSDGDGAAEVWTAPNAGGGPTVRAFSATGTPLTSYFAYASEFRGGLTVAAGDVTSDGIDDIITATLDLGYTQPLEVFPGRKGLLANSGAANGEFPYSRQ